MPETRDMLLNVGPAHPAMHGVIRIIATLDGEQVVNCEVEIGYLHRGFEKVSEVVDYNGVIPYTDRLNYVSPLINNMGYCMAVEKAIGASVPERCHYIRVILSEISRITDHLTCIGAVNRGEPEFSSHDFISFTHAIMPTGSRWTTPPTTSTKPSLPSATIATPVTPSRRFATSSG